VRPERRDDFQKVVRGGQMDAAAATIGIDQFNTFRVILRKLSFVLTA
jgi:hypothetical protein